MRLIEDHQTEKTKKQTLLHMKSTFAFSLSLGFALISYACKTVEASGISIIHKVSSGAAVAASPLRSPALMVLAGGQGENRQRNHRAIAKQPLGTFLLDQLRLFSPSTWLGIAKLRPDVSWQWQKFFRYMTGILLPAIGYYGFTLATKILWTGFSSAGISSAAVITEICSLNKLQHVNFLIPFTPWSIFCLWKGTEGIRSVARGIWSASWFSGKQSNANPDAWETLSERISSGRAHRSRRYDLYLPPPSDKKGNNKGQQEAIILLPGFGVEHCAYAGPAALFSDAGYVVVVVSAEPLRAASPELGCTPGAIRRIQRQVCQQIGHELTSWSLVGHSMGAFTATQLVGPLNLRRVVMWASAPAFLDALSQDEHFLTNTHVLIIQGSNDKVIELYVKSKEQWREFNSRLPRGTVTRTISGGTHGGFGSYTSVWFTEEPIINRSEQHRQAVQLTVRFLRLHSATRSYR